ncbi:AarF/ABC1/UbiB kinase family protein [Mycobacterium sp. CVI_P3]|uniref:AarF/ABC1/UbiB kinase family protein n=1 Tax=Mycobacterium pinniadriaticum TaxID=2994102 RepID=A0ABT3SG90_9MYCO|nr:AarF/ABC1/UbiB kinase family protein [Mycobacterium pinniadriaticum]MCX2932111.1 AarF/ABC1/UbiB kinase family protein [Mycobacterium pinniadriaticum]MCX2938535.1 AarF/ABC1/UbiB kinase family protein [Mycobacterium pinniadriaticum]
MPLASLTAHAACGRVIAGLRERAGQDGALERFHLSTAARYAELLGRSRGVLMKAGQILSMADTREWGGGGFGPYLDALKQVQCEVPPMDPVLVRQLLDAQLGAGVGQFAEFVDQPIATASIGQVHRAVLRDGRAVAVKVQYPGVARAIEDDLANAELLGTFLKVVRAATAMRTDVGDVAREVAARIREEVDYRHEAATIKAFGELYRGHPFIRIPQVVDEASGDRVLTMTYLDGMDWAQAQHADQDLKNTWAETIMRFNYSTGRLSNLLHGDPHPGNYRYFGDGTVGFLDFGCVQVKTQHECYGWTALIRAAVDGRKADMRDLAAQMGLLDADPTLTADELYRWAVDLMYDFIAAPQPVTYTPEFRARRIRSMFDFRDRDHTLARVSLPAMMAFTARIQLNLVNICTTLGATLPVRAILDDTDGVAEPITALGRQHHAWVRERGLRLVPPHVCGGPAQ